ncbi:hypothetical protein AB833_13130 [Chromatiales bacterium (ex Bugula neritina AB1)]|nr:hypothetical protein AB833_13130 [Chromatiales bacterium (ex Bugula neritina AB1)]
MRLRKLALERFGHFTDQEFDFGEKGDSPDFHIIYGLNEAGKTTTMEAALRLFYGFPPRDSYDFKHQRKNLQVSGQLEIDHTLTTHFTRLSTRNGSLRDQNNTALPETALATHLAGLSLDDYRQLLCLDDDTIERGGEEIVKANGDIGRLLFSAAAGVAGLSLALNEVRETADQIWRKRASKTQMAELKRELSAIEKTIREQDVSASKWHSLKKQYADAQLAENQARATHENYREAALIIAAKIRALPKLKQIDDLISRTADYSDYPTQLDFDPEDLVAMQSDENLLKADLQRLSSEIESAQLKLNSIDREPELAALSDKLGDLDDLRARDMTAGKDIERRRREMQNHHSAMERAARDLGVTDQTDLQSLVLSSTEIQRVDANREALRLAEHELDSENREVTELRERFEKAGRNAEKAANESPDSLGFSHILERFDADRLAPVFVKVQQELYSAGRTASKALSALSIGSIQFETIPTVETSAIQAQIWADTYSEINQRITQEKNELANHSEDVSTRQAQIKMLASDRKLISDNEALILREERDQFWQVHRTTLSDQTAQVFENSMSKLDAATESRLLRASDLGQLRQTDLSLTEAQTRADHALARLATLNHEKTAIESEVNSAASAAGLPVPQAPAVWLEWIQHHEKAAEAAHEVAELQRQHQHDINQAEKLHRELCNRLNLESPDFETAITHARKQARSETEAISFAKAANNSLKEIAANLASRQQKQQKAEAAKQKARETWQIVLSELFGDIDIQEALLISIDPLRSLREHNDNYERTKQRVSAMEADRAQFLQEVSRLCESHGLALEGSASDTYSMLGKLSNDAQAKEAEVSSLKKTIEAAKTDQLLKTKELENITHKVQSIGSIFPNGAAVDTLDALRKTAKDSQRVISEHNTRAELELELITELGVENISKARETLADATAAQLKAKAETSKLDVTEAEKQLTQATEARVLAGENLSRVTGDSELGVLIERKTTIELQLEQAALEYLELDLGHTMANEAIQRYQDTHRSGMMAATEKCFATLTQGAYPQLKTEPDASNEVLLAVDKNGATKRAAEMSKGTRFQLYLALRAAAHEQMVTQGTSLPFFCDDIFETFDEDRTRAACQVMEQIGSRGQAIYLTHHRHVVDIAQQVCATSPKIHELQ